MNEIVRVTLWIVVLTAGLTGYFLAIGALFAKRVTQARALIAAAPGRSFGVGLVNVAFFSVIVVVMLGVVEGAAGGLRAALSIPAVLIAAGLVVALSFGLTAMTGLIGERLLPQSGALQQSVWGTIVLSLGCTLPFAGWFLLLPYSGLTGAGAFLLSFFQRDGG
jgi:hypothetical protein